jgi:hypothetical protein
MLMISSRTLVRERCHVFGRETFEPSQVGMPRLKSLCLTLSMSPRFCEGDLRNWGLLWGTIRVFVGEFGSFDQSSLDDNCRPGTVLLCLVFGPRSSTRFFSEFLLNGC